MKEKLNFGEWNLPTSWDKVTLRQLMDIEKMQSEGSIDPSGVIAVLSGHDIDEVNALPIQFVEKMVENLDYLKEMPDVKPSAMIEIGDETYQVEVKEKMSFGEFVAVQTALDADQHCYSTILAILCRKPGEKYTSDFENQVLPERIKIFENASCIEALKVVGFFLTVYQLRYVMPSQLSSLKEAALSLTQENIESLRRSGRGSRLLTSLQTRKLKRLRKYIERTF